MSFNPPPPPEGTPPGEVPGYPGPGEFPTSGEPPAPYSDPDPSPYQTPPPYMGAPQYPGGMGAPQYPGGQYGGGMPPVASHPNATVILVMGILGLVICAPLGIVAW